MPRFWPALDIPSADDLVLAALDSYSPTAIEETDDGMRVFFSNSEQRDAARLMLLEKQHGAVAFDVSDEDWAVRSQQSLEPVTVDGIRVLPRLPDGPAGSGAAIGTNSDIRPVAPALLPTHLIDIVITPSMGFGTGHHATTRLCLAALQAESVDGKSVLDVGTGSGILAIAAARLGAVRAHGIDVDADAVHSANENLASNPQARSVSFAVADLRTAPLLPCDIVLANLTGAVLVRSAAPLLSAARSGGTLILSGILAAEAQEVAGAFDDGARIVRQEQEDEWVCLVMKKV
jgi:ribosomal protein L11 methyltransferase